MNLAEIKACAARRTQGKWDARDWMCGDHDAEFIAMAANHIDVLIAIAEAATVYVKNMSAVCFSGDFNLMVSERQKSKDRLAETLVAIDAFGELEAK